MARREIVVYMINEINYEVHKKENTPNEEKDIVVNILKKYRKSGVSKKEVINALSDISLKHQSTFTALWSEKLE